MVIATTPFVEGRIVDLVQVGALNGAGIEYRALAPAAQPTTLLPLVTGTEFYAADWLAALHQNRHTKGSLPIGCYFLPGLKVSGIGHLYIDGKLVLTPEIVPAYWRKAIMEYGIPNIDEEVAKPARTIQGQTIVFVGWGESTYGHLLIEMLPRLLAAQIALGAAFRDAAILVPRNVARWFTPMLADIFGADLPRVEWYDPQSEQIVLEAAVLPTLSSEDGWFHPYLNTLIDPVRDRLVAPRPDNPLAERIFITRALFSNPESWQRRCRNELKLAEIAGREFGFAVLPLETLKWTTQVKFLAGARIIAGEFGSGLHGALFAEPDTIVAAVGFQNLTQSTIGALRRQQNAYLLPGPADAAGNYEVNEDLFRGFLTALVA